MEKATQPDWKDTNVSEIGSDADKKQRKECAGKEPEWAEIDPNATGVLMWRIEAFQVKKVAKDRLGKFYKGDSYLCLHSYLDPGDEDSRKILRDIYYIIGPESTADEYGTDAYKTVELDDFFDGEPKQYREEMLKLSDRFKNVMKETYGKDVELDDGGCPTGFRHVPEPGYDTKLIQVRKGKSSAGHDGHGKTEQIRLPLKANLINEADVYILDGKEKLFIYQGANASPKEKYEGKTIAENIENTRGSGIKLEEATRETAEFWSLLEGEAPPASGGYKS